MLIILATCAFSYYNCCPLGQQYYTRCHISLLEFLCGLACAPTCRCSEAVCLLTLSQGSACLLAEVLSDASPDREGGVVSEYAVAAAIGALNDVHVHTLSPQQARHVLLKRLYAN